MPMYIPKRVFISSKCVGLRKTEEYLNRIQKWNPEVDVTEYDGEFAYPSGSTPHDMYHYAKDSILINERSANSPFIQSFPSPGNIVEDFTTVGNLTWQCASKCHFCYLMLTRPYEKYFYTNLDRFENELATAPYAHRAILTLWTMVTHALRTSFMKIPTYLYRASDNVRADCVRLGVLSDEDAQQYLLQHANARIYQDLQREWLSSQVGTPFPLGEDALQFPENTIRSWYRENSTRPLRLTISEFTDLVAVDHLTGNLDYVLSLLPRFPDVEFVVRTKSTYFDEMLKHNGLGRVHVTISFNTARAIEKYEQGTSSLEERIEAFKRVQAANGYHPQVAIEPIIAYEGCVEEYKSLVHQIMRSIDPQRIGPFTIGAVRYRVTDGNLMTSLKRNFPKSDILETPEVVQKAEPLDGRKRYSERFRENIYSEMFKVFRQYNSEAALRLGTEKQVLWDTLGLDRTGYMSTSVYQYTPGEDTTMRPIQPQQKPASVETPKEPPKEEEPPTLERQPSAKCQIAMLGIGTTNRNQPETLADVDMLEAADELLEGMDRPDAKDGWNTVFSNTIREALLEEYYSPVKILGWIGDITDPIPIKPRNKVQARELNLRGFQLRIVDSDRRELKTLMVPVQAFGSSLYDLKRQNQRIVFCGAVVHVNLRRGQEPRFFLWNVIPSYTAEDLIGVDKGYDAAPLRKTFEEEVSKPNGIFTFIRKELIEKLGVAGVKDFPELGKCIDVMIYQSFSDGMNSAPRYSNKLHTLVIGPPGIGKKFLIDLAKMINPVFNLATSVSGKINVAGLVAAVVGTGAKRISQPGYLPLSSGGVLALSDFHQLKGNRAAVLAALSEAMEDGKVTDSNSPRTSHEAETSIHVDLNRVVDVDPSRPVDTYSDVNIPYNIISRFDFIIDLPGDLEVRLKPIEAMFSKATVLSSYPSKELMPRWQRDLQRLVAYMRTYWREVGIPVEVNEYALRRVKEEFGVVGGHSTFLDARVLESNITRTARSVHKFVKAIACADHNPVATKGDVDRAFEFIREKIRFLATYREEDISSMIDPRRARIQERLDRIVAAFGNREFTTGQVIDMQEPGANEGERKTIRQQVNRDLERLVHADRLESVRQGRWKLKGGSDRAKPQRRAKRVKTRKPARKTKPTKRRKRGKST